MQPNKKNASRRYQVLYGVAAVLMIAVVITSQLIVNDLTKTKTNSDFVLNHEREFPRMQSGVKETPEQPVIPEATSIQNKDLKTILPVLNPDPVTRLHPKHAGNIIAPPIKEFDIPFTRANVDASMGQIIKTKTQSKIMIPPDAFVDKNGKAVSGNVDVKFREFHNYQDILLSGIPMKYHSGTNGDQQLESAGMIEVLASKDNEQLYMSPGKQVKIMLASFTKETDYNLYYFDPEKKQWIQKGKDQVTSVPDPYATKVDMSENYADVSRPAYVYDLKKYSLRFFSQTDMTPKRKFMIGKKEIPQSFEFQIISSSKGFPELKNLSQQKWIYKGEKAVAVYYDLIMRKSRDKKMVRPEWQKLTLTPVEGKDAYTLLLQNQGETLQIEIEPALKSKRQRKLFEKKYQQYASDHDKRLKKDSEAYLKWQRDTALEASRSVQYTQQVATTNLIMRNFAINNFGVWNCDRPMEVPSAVAVMASFTDQDKKVLKPETIYLVDKKVNTVFTFNLARDKGIKFNPNSVNMLYTVLPDGKIAVLKPITFSEAEVRKNKGQCNFIMQVCEKPKVAEEMRKLISL